MTGTTEGGAETIPAVLYDAAEQFGDLEAVVDGAERVSFAGLAVRRD